MPLSRWTSYIWKDVFFSVEISTCWLLQQVPEGQFLKKSLGDADSALCLSLTTLPFFFFFFQRDFHLLLLESQVHGSPSLQTESCFMVEHPWRAGCGHGLQRRAQGRRGLRLGTCGRVPGPPLRATLSQEGVGFSTTRTDQSFRDLKNPFCELSLPRGRPEQASSQDLGFQKLRANCVCTKWGA